MTKIKFTILLLICWFAAVFAQAFTQRSGETESAFGALQVRETTDRAMEQLRKLATTNPDSRKYLITHLPGVIDAGPTSVGWKNAVHLARDLHLAEVAPVLAKWIGAKMESYGPVSTSMRRRVENYPAGESIGGDRRSCCSSARRCA